MITYPNAKINLGLNIVEKRPDGYHNLETIFYPIHLQDALEVNKIEGKGDYSLKVSGVPIEGEPENNLVVKAYHLLKKDFPDMPSIHIHMYKHIPTGAGLGGGSADAAFMIKLLNEKFNLGLSTEKMEEYADKVEEANQKYIDGLQDALDAEKDLYNKNQSIDDRETLQRQLALLRRSGGSASEIADLEAELDNMLKDEYFANQQEAIDNIQKVNEAQLEALQQQIQLEEDALAFQQEHGLIWNQVNEIMQGGFDSMMNFFTAKDNEFFEASALAQIEKLDDWAKRVGIYDEDQAHQKHEDKAAANYWDNNAIWSDASLAGMQQVFNGMADGDKKAIKDTFLNAYANAKMSGKSEDEAKAAGINSITSALNAEKERQTRAAQQSVSNTVQNTPAPPATPEPENKFRYVYMYGNKLDENGKTKRVTVGINTDSYDYDKIRRIIKGYQKSRGIQSWVNEKLYGFSEGGLVDYTGPAIVHGTPARPEGFLNAEQTAQIRDALAISGDSTLLNILRSVASQLKVVSGAVSNSVSNNRSIEIAQGAVQVQVGTLANSYDVEDLSNDIMGRIVAIADKSTNRSVGRR